MPEIEKLDRSSTVWLISYFFYNQPFSLTASLNFVCNLTQRFEFRIIIQKTKTNECVGNVTQFCRTAVWISPIGTLVRTGWLLIFRDTPLTFFPYQFRRNLRGFIPLCCYLMWGVVRIYIINFGNKLHRNNKRFTTSLGWLSGGGVIILKSSNTRFAAISQIYHPTNI